MSFPKWVLPCLLLGSSTAAYGEDLLEIYRQALAHDARWAAAQHAAAAGGEKLAQGRAALLPTLTVSGSKTYYDASIEYQSSTPLAGGDRDYSIREYGANLTQPLYRKPNFALYLQSRAQAALAEIQLAAARTDLALRVAQAYFDVLFAQDALQLTTAQKTAFQKEHDQAQARFAAGAVAITDVHETRARLDLAVSQEIAALNDVEIKRQGLRRITGLAPMALLLLKTDLSPLLPEPNNIDHWVNKADELNPQVQAQRLTLEVADREVEKASGAHHPTVDAVANYTVNNSTGGVAGGIYTNVESDIKSKSAGIQVQIPIYQGGGTRSREREAVALREQAREELTDARRLVALQTRQAFLTVSNSLAQIMAMEQAVASSNSLLDATRESAKAGLKTRTDVLNTEQQLFGAKRDLARARYSYLLGMLQLKASAGTLVEEDLASANNLLVRE
jgi:outer membrane protein